MVAAMSCVFVAVLKSSPSANIYNRIHTKVNYFFNRLDSASLLLRSYTIDKKNFSLVKLLCVHHSETTIIK